MESLYARDTPTAHDRKLKLSTSHEDEQVTLKAPEKSNQEQPTESLDSLMDSSTTQAIAVDSTAVSAEDTFGFTFSSLPESQQPLDEQWRRDLTDAKAQQESHPDNTKTEGERPAGSAASSLEKPETKTAEAVQPDTTNSTGSEPTQPRRTGVASMPRKQKPTITINTGSGLTSVGAKRPPPTPVSPPTFSWNDILRVQNLIERST
ncbi:hypothetical protein DVH05_016062 [Phytophthora capsici]|nr:hypothetical protein DVH05_016062 [Phytophthora capsici]